MKNWFLVLCFIVGCVRAEPRVSIESLGVGPSTLFVAMHVGDPSITEDEVQYIASAVENDWPAVFVVPVTQDVFVIAATTNELPLLNATMLVMGDREDCFQATLTPDCVGATWPGRNHSRVYSESILCPCEGSRAIALGNAASHEVGHLLGLGHNNNPLSLMQAAFSNAQVCVIDYSP